MQAKPSRFQTHFRAALSLVLVLVMYNSSVHAWGREGHGAVGILAIESLQTESRNQLEEIMGSLSSETLIEACNWPDAVRETTQWEWTYPMHYINIPRGDFQYLESRDCPDQLCATQAIKRYTKELADPQAGAETRRQAFAWLCHLTGDLHQPLHAGFADDRGGNNFEVVFRSEETNLHGIWDSSIIKLHTDSAENLSDLLRDSAECRLDEEISQELINNWTNESHELAKHKIYPSSKSINEAYETRSWKLIQKRLNKAASRLALLINSTLPGEKKE